MSLYIRMFLAMSIPFGIVMGIVMSSFEGGVVGGLVFGSIMVLVLGTINRLSGNTGKGSAGVRHSGELELQLAYDAAYDICVEAIAVINNCKIKEDDRSQGRIVAKAGATWKTWGDVITFELNETGNGTTKIKVSSRPVVPTTMLDYGKNRENVDRIVEFINSRTMSVPDKNV